MTTKPRFDQNKNRIPEPKSPQGPFVEGCSKCGGGWSPHWSKCQRCGGMSKSALMRVTSELIQQVAQNKKGGSNEKSRSTQARTEVGNVSSQASQGQEAQKN